MTAAKLSAFENDWLKQWALYAPESIAFQDAETGVRYSYAKLYDLSQQLALHLSTQFGVEAGDRVAVFAGNELEYIPLFFATHRLGAILVPINFRLTGREVAHIIEDSEPRLIIREEKYSSVIAIACERFLPQGIWSFDGRAGLRPFLLNAAAVPAASAMAVVSRSQDPCMILYTSGTTGAPKGAMITFDMIHWNSISTGLRLNLNQSDVAVTFSPFFHTSGWNVLVTPFLHRGARTVLIRKFDAEKILELCEQEQVTVLFGVPTTMEMMARSPNFARVDLSSIRFAVVGGEPMPIDLIHAWENKGIPIRQGYGLTEFGPNVFSLNEQDSIRKIGSIGFANFYIETRIVDDEDRDLAVGEIGELVLRGPVCTPGYWRNPEATSHAIKNGWFHTGDLVRKDAEGYHYVAGRKKDMFISGGENVYPVEVERFLSTHPAIREVAVIGVPDAKWGEVGKAFIALKTGCEISSREILAFCEGNLAKYKIPKSVAILTELPKGDSGKILKRKLAEATEQRPPLAEVMT